MGRWAGSGDTHCRLTRETRVSTFTIASLSRVLLIGRLNSSVPQGALKWYFDRPVARIATCHYGTDDERADVKKSSALYKGRATADRADGKSYVVNMWDNILPKVNKQVQLTV